MAEESSTTGSQLPRRFSLWRGIKWLLTPRFSLRTLLAVITLLAVVLGLWCERAERQHRALLALKELDCTIEPQPDPWYFAWLPESVLAFREGSYFRRVKSVNRSGDANQVVANCQDLPDLRELDLSASQLSAESFAKLGRLRSLEYLGLSGLNVRDDDLKELAKLGRLKTLMLNRTQITNEGLRHVAKLSRLDLLEIKGTRINDEGLEHLAPLKHLTHVDLFETNVTGRGMAHWTCDNLRDLIADDTLFDDDGAALLARFPELRSLSLDETYITGGGGQHIAKAVPRLDDLSLDGTWVDNAALTEIAKLPHLETLNVLDCPIDDAGVASLAGAPNLGHVSLDENISGNAKLDLFRTCPNLDHLKVPGGVTHDAWGHSALRRGAQSSITYFSAIPGSSFTNEDWHTITQATVLQNVSVSNTNLDDTALAQLAALPVLTSLTAAGCPITDDGMESLVAAGKLNYLDLSRTRVTTAGIERLSQSKTMTRLLLSGCSAIDDTAIDAFLRMPGLTELDLTGTQVTAAGWERLAALPKLEALGINEEKLTPEHLAILGRFPSLKRIGLTNRKFGDDANRVLFPKTNRGKLRDLGVPREIPATPEILQQIAGQPRLQLLSFAGHPITDEQFTILDPLTELFSLSTTGARLTGESLERALSRPKLRFLELAGAEINDEDLLRFHAVKTLRHLRLSDTRITDNGLPHLGHLVGLDQLGLAGCDVSLQGLERLPPSFFAEITILFVARTQVRQTDVPRLMELCPKLERVVFDRFITDVREVRRMQSDPIESEHWIELKGAFVDDAMVFPILEKQPLLRVIDLGHTSNTSAVLSAIGRLQWLRKLSIEHCPVNDASLVELTKCVYLRDLSLDGTRITDAGLLELAGAKNLRVLSLKQTAVTDAGIEHLARIKSLREIDLEETPVTAEGAAALRKSLPFCKVKWKGPDQAPNMSTDRSTAE